MIKLWGIYISFFAVGIIGFLLILKATPNTEKRILGEWKEIKWEYDKVNTRQQTKLAFMPEEIKDMVGKQLIIHEAETWLFNPNGTLTLFGRNSEKTVEWRLKGRGHILQLKHTDNRTEQYNIDILNGKTLVLNFESNMEVRGIAKLTFNKSGG
ncbi:MAG: hypothetical protein KF900_12580 [Bacteroidetes bacterium]|nr:hypothetical protein [Bacteroidota bacterium]